MSNNDVWKVESLNVVYAQKPFPTTVTKTLFLAGPTPRKKGAISWRQEALSYLQNSGFDGHVFVPEPEKGVWGDNYDSQIEWEENGLNRADCIVFWIPRDMTGAKFFGYPMPGLTTNDEWGFWKDSGKVVLGVPASADHIKYQLHYAKKFGVPTAYTFKETLQAALEKLGSGALRTGGECCIPLHIWKKPEFQAWYTSQKNVGNSINEARVVWSFTVPPPAFGLGPPKRVFLYAVHANMHIASEKRDKLNEVVLLRPDISSVLLYGFSPDGQPHIVLVKEYRTPVRNEAAMVYELPGGSSLKPGEDPLGVAAHEVEEETGLRIDPKRFQVHQSRQLVATLSGHVSTLFSARLTTEEMGKLASDTKAHGVEADTERTYVEVIPITTVLENQLLDWSTLGMVLSILRPQSGRW